MKRWFSLALALALMAGPVNGLTTARAEALEEEIIIEQIEVIDSNEAELTLEEAEEIPAPEAASEEIAEEACFARYIRLSDETAVYPTADAEAPFARVRGVAIALESAAGRTGIAFFTGSEVLTGYVDGSAAHPLNDDEIAAYMDAAASGAVALYMNRLDAPLAPVACAFIEAEPEEEIVEETAEEITEEPVGEIPEEPIEETSEEPVEEITEEPTEEPDEVIAEEIPEEPTEAPVEAPAQEIAGEPAEEIVEAPVEIIDAEPVVPEADAADEAVVLEAVEDSVEETGEIELDGNAVANAVFEPTEMESSLSLRASSSSAQLGWVEKNGQWYYYLSRSSKAVGWNDIDGTRYYFSSSGVMQTGWKKIDGEKYYFSASGRMMTGWVCDEGKWYYLDAQGHVSTGVVRINNQTYCMDDNGQMLTGWQKIDNIWHFFRDNGLMATGWQQIDGLWYLFNSEGIMLTGWQKVGGSWFFLKSSGEMLTGWQQINGSWFYLRSSGAMVTGWQQINGNWFYLRSSGEMLTGWRQISDKWYFLKSSGEMLTGWQLIGNDWYYLDASGAMVTGWQRIGDSWFYFADNGKMISENNALSLSLSLSTEAISIGKSETCNALTAELTSETAGVTVNGAITWSSSDTRVVKVNASTGALTGVAKGSATVTAKAINGLSADCDVTVTDAPTRITLSPAQASLTAGESGQYQVTLTGGASSSVTFTSDNIAVATVDSDGLVTAVAPGVAVITATTYNGKSATSTLTVRARLGSVADGDPEVSTTDTYRENMTDAEKIEYLIYLAQTKLGKPYVYGSFGPNSFDCSGFTYWCYQQIGIKLKDSAYTQGYDDRLTKIYDPAQLKRGDIVCFDTVSDSDLCDHTGIYLGNGKFIHASSSAKKVIVSTLASGYYNRVFSWGRRVLGWA